MKKTYINPVMQVVKWEMPQLLAGSPELKGTLSTEDPILGRELNVDEWL
ncbi:MAG: hypothetical protein IJ069_08425 [Prevotella sp.]|jgi:hypothetical protein|nr:hypothetical protein [Prevotella sp.]MBQ8713857.1 hypothetical protein [Prevotella sp.]